MQKNDGSLVHLDCVIVGGGPAGLTAATYLGRYRRKVAVVDDGNSRARWIPKSHNCPGFPEGVSGEELLARMRDQARHYGAQFLKGRIEAIHSKDRLFVVHGEGLILESRTVLLATGTENRRPDVDPETHQLALQKGQLRYCPVCDGFEAADQAIGVIGATERGVSEAMFLRTYSSDVTLLAVEAMDIDAQDHTCLERAQIKLEHRPLARLHFGEDGVTAHLADGAMLQFDTVYPALGSDSNDMLAKALGLKMGDGCCIAVDQKQRTSRKGVYAAGDIVHALDQISVAVGHAAIAATTLHNDLRESDGQTRGR